MNNKSNEALRRMAWAAYQRRPVLPEQYQTMRRLEQVNGGLFCDFWFMSGGCSHDAQGGCTMCNYGKSGGKVHREEILSQIRQMISSFSKPFEDFLLTPSGSFLDEKEVPADFREQLLKEMQQLQAKRFIVETRADTITEEKLTCFRHLREKTDCYIEIGLESSNDWILKHCVNKGMAVQDFQQAVDRVHRSGMKVTANIGIGIPFLPESMAVSCAVQTVWDALHWGADSVVLFPYHVKQGTVLRDMERLGLYQCISLWTLIEILWQVRDCDLSRVQISWYKDYYEKNASGICSSPKTCPKCNKQVERLLDQYRDEPEQETLNLLYSLDCDCREHWREETKREADAWEYQQIEEKYFRLAQYYGIDQKLLEEELKIMREEFDRMRNSSRVV